MQESPIAASGAEAPQPDAPAAADYGERKPFWPEKTHTRAGITKNHNRGQSKQRRKMAAQSRRRNRKVNA